MTRAIKMYNYHNPQRLSGAISDMYWSFSLFFPFYVKGIFSICYTCLSCEPCINHVTEDKCVVALLVFFISHAKSFLHNTRNVSCPPTNHPNARSTLGERRRAQENESVFSRQCLRRRYDVSKDKDEVIPFYGRSPRDTVRHWNRQVTFLIMKVMLMITPDVVVDSHRLPGCNNDRKQR